jgi:hypothetical protein
MEIMISDARGDSVAVTLNGVVERRGRVQLGVTGGGIKEVLVGMTDRVKVLKDIGALIYITTKQQCHSQSKISTNLTPPPSNFRSSVGTRMEENQCT